MKRLLTQLDEMKHEKQEHIKKLQKDKNDILKEIEGLRKIINDSLDQMEKALVSDVESKLAGQIQSTIQCVETFKIMKSSVVKSQKALQEAKVVNDAELFVQLKRGNENLVENERNLEQLYSEGDLRSVKLFPKRLKDVFFDENENIFGRVSEIIIPKSFEHIGDFNVRLQSDKETCIIGDCCLTTNGDTVCIDFNNKRLKKLKGGYNSVMEHLDLPDSPVSLCEVDATQLAVTLINDKKVQFVFQKPLKLGRWFNVGDHCRGIDCDNNQLYVCCGGNKIRNEGPGHIEIYDMNGGLLRTFYEGLSLPWYIKAARYGELYLTDRYSSSSTKLFKINTHNFNLSEIHIKTLADVNRFCRVGDGQFCFEGWHSNNIVLITEDGEQQQELLTEKGGIVGPSAVFFNEKLLQMIVFLDESDVIKVYRVIT